MAVFAVSFDLEYDTDYQSRYSSFMEQVKKTGDWWGDTTSFVIVRTAESIDSFCSRIYVDSRFNATKDLYLVSDTEKLSARIRGKIRDRDIFNLMPYLIEL
ncbi:hypothetical protein LPJ38_34765 [Bradyrhizobium daqingense]|uniref:Uncharacterized protein n=1 Tax=Bradyrhizobium daqingense TaxID=993502 RepID=A0A562L2Z3_9BRAD|nr:hypothetical protein [Bradyrhizobium daqingense]TWI02029.1 hypothetical protein IQ17_04389 [Bradyrhizobium daqingense]UFS88731.1 hypothetical protein LPJ38_34765 [Bradyrhizobium daqingense]